MSATGRGAQRAKHDHYPTPAWPVHRLLERLSLPGGNWLEPCSGSGAIIRAVNDIRSDVRWSACDIRKACARPCVASGAAFYHRDFLTSKLAEEVVLPKVIITNPPYSLAREFVEACFPSGAIVIMLLRLNWLEEGEIRRGFLSAHTPDVYVLPNRPGYVLNKAGKRGTDATSYAWMVWPPHGWRSEGRLQILGHTDRAERRPKPALPNTKKEPAA